MNALRNQKSWVRFAGSAALLGFLAFAGSGQRAAAQQNLRGEVVLPMEARLGDTVLPQGTYKFTVQPIGISRTIETSMVGNYQVLVTLVGESKGAPITSILATASKVPLREDGSDSIQVEGAEHTFQSMSLNSMGVMLKFYENKAKNVMHETQPETSKVVTAAKGNV